MKSMGIALVIASIFFVSSPTLIPEEKPKPKVEAVLLGIAQDGGIPQAGCYCDNCNPKQESKEPKEKVASLGIIDHENKGFWIIDATPDFPAQLNTLQRLNPDYTFSGIILTHAHIGHYTGLMFLGKEVMGAKNIPVYVTRRFADFLKNNGPWSLLVKIQNIEIMEIEPYKDTQLSNNVKITPVLVPHRDEFSDTIAIQVNGPNKKLLYCPDTDTWDLWKTDIIDVISSVDFALIDGTFYTPDEIPGRDFSKIRHPLIKTSIDKFRRLETSIIFVHLNHTNPLYNAIKEAEIIKYTHMKIGREGDIWQL